MSDKKKKKNQDIETTPLIDMNDTFDEEDVTIRESSPDLEEDDDESVTVKLKAPEEQTAVSKRIKMIQKRHQEQSVAKELSSLVSNLGEQALKLWPKKFPAAIKWGAFALAGLILALMVVFLWPERKIVPVGKTLTQKKAESRKSGPGVKFTAVTYWTAEGEPIQNKRVQRGKPVHLKFNVTRWQTGKNKETHIVVDTRIYDARGKLVLFQPRVIKYIGRADPKLDHLAVDTRFFFKKTATPGYYRVQLSVLDRQSNKQGHMQTKFKLMP